MSAASAPHHHHASRTDDLRHFVHSCSIRDLEALRDMIATELEPFAESQVVSMTSERRGWVAERAASTTGGFARGEQTDHGATVTERH